MTPFTQTMIYPMVQALLHADERAILGSHVHNELARYSYHKLFICHHCYIELLVKGRRFIDTEMEALLEENLLYHLKRLWPFLTPLAKKRVYARMRCLQKEIS